MTIKTANTATTAAFTLVEILVTLTIIGMLALIASAVTSLSSRDEACYQDTLAIMDRIEQALLGVPPTHLAGERRYLGYIADMGELPELLGSAGQPAGLWTDGLAGDYGAEADLPAWAYTGDDTRLWIGWHGPYIDAPAGVLRDGWGNPILFERFDISDEGTEIKSADGHHLRFTSLGADGLARDEGDADTGYAADIERVVRAQDYLGSLAGYKDKEIISVTIYYPSQGQLTSKTITSEDDGYFFSGDDTDALLAMGTRCLQAAGSSAPAKTILFSLEPTANFIGTIR